MSKQVKYINCPVTDHGGWRFENAVVAVREAEAETKLSIKTPDCIQPYTINQTMGTLVVSLSFWMDLNTKNKGCLPKSILTENINYREIHAKIDIDEKTDIDKIREDYSPLQFDVAVIDDKIMVTDIRQFVDSVEINLDAQMTALLNSGGDAIDNVLRVVEIYFRKTSK